MHNKFIDFYNTILKLIFFIIFYLLTMQNFTLTVNRQKLHYPNKGREHNFYAINLLTSTIN